MELCLELTKIAENYGEIPIAAMVVLDDRIVGIGLNNSIILQDATAHAEVLAIREAGRRVENYRLVGSTIYTTLEPCPMCAGAILHARCARIVFGAQDFKTGAIGGRFNLYSDFTMNHIPEVTSGVRGAKVSEELLKYFRRKRELKKEQKRLLKVATQMYEES
ncbi:tRNA adenosine(34) deaminase TadA [Psittacicella hinzii]|uniref:tRNA-specific adenosine deaminase n=2 Tax=Psittacicella hinzii TaxID=2028575 RepID=A0A3A1YEA1_9GAMM|nr:tRNA adenosine(34) deaminase TadA [Psittacicella hinzii]